MIGPPVAATGPRLLGIGGTARPGSTSERVLHIALERARQSGATVEILTARDLDLPMYDAEVATRSAPARRFLDAVRRCDGLIISSPGYHGGPPGLLKNALDFLQDLAEEPEPYLDDRAVGCVVSAYGPQAAVTTLSALRSTVHALRGWPTPLGVVVDSSAGGLDDRVEQRLGALVDQVVRFATAFRGVAA